jgi:hypothetical protein
LGVWSLGVALCREGGVTEEVPGYFRTAQEGGGATAPSKNEGGLGGAEAFWGAFASHVRPHQRPPKWLPERPSCYGCLQGGVVGYQRWKVLRVEWGGCTPFGGLWLALELLRRSAGHAPARARGSNRSRRAQPPPQPTTPPQTPITVPKPTQTPQIILPPPQQTLKARQGGRPSHHRGHSTLVTPHQPPALSLSKQNPKRHVKEADRAIIAAIKGAGRLVDVGVLVHSYPYCWRSDTPLIYRAVPSWFVAVSLGLLFDLPLTPLCACHDHGGALLARGGAPRSSLPLLFCSGRFPAVLFAPSPPPPRAARSGVASEPEAFSTLAWRAAAGLRQRLWVSVGSREQMQPPPTTASPQPPPPTLIPLRHPPHPPATVLKPRFSRPSFRPCAVLGGG